MKNREITITARDARIDGKEGILVECTVTNAKSDFDKAILISRVIQALEQRYGDEVMTNALLMSMIKTSNE